SSRVRGTILGGGAHERRIGVRWLGDDERERPPHGPREPTDGRVASRRIRRSDGELIEKARGSGAARKVTDRCSSRGGIEKRHIGPPKHCSLRDSTRLGDELDGPRKTFVVAHSHA